MVYDEVCIARCARREGPSDDMWLKYLDAPQESDNTEVQSEKIWPEPNCPVLKTIVTWEF